MPRWPGAFRAAAVLAALVLTPGLARAEDALRRATGERAAPELVLEDIDGNRREIDYRGRLTLVHVWATWCAPCREELPALAALRSAFPGRGLQVVAVTADSHEATRGFLAQHNLPFTVLIDQYGTAMKAWRVRGLPTTHVVDAAGRVRLSAMGRVDWASTQVRGQIEALLPEPAQGPDKTP